MLSTRKKTSGIAGLVLIVTYSVIMMMSGGTAGNWAWLVLAAGIMLLVIPATSAISSGKRNDG